MRVERGGREWAFPRLGLLPEALVDDLAISLMVGTKDDVLEAVRPRLESSDLLRSHANRVERSDLAPILADLDRSRPSEDHVDLLCVLVTMRERLALARLDAHVGKTSLLGG